MTPIETYIEVAKVVWPIAAWVAWVNHNVKQNRKDIDAWYYDKRGGKGMRDRTLRGRCKRWLHKLKDKRNGTDDRKHGSGNAEKASNGKIHGPDRSAGA